MEKNFHQKKLKRFQKKLIQIAETVKPKTDKEPEKPQTVPGATAAPGAELVRNESGEVTEVKPLNGGIDADAQDKINKRLDEEKTDVKDAEERLAVAKHDEKEAESNREEAKAAVESAKENVKAAQDELVAAKEAKAKFEKRNQQAMKMLTVNKLINIEKQQELIQKKLKQH